jgi:CheY-like chemotaxis protein
LAEPELYTDDYDDSEDAFEEIAVGVSSSADVVEALQDHPLEDDEVEFEQRSLEHIFDPESETQLWNEFSDFAIDTLASEADGDLEEEPIYAESESPAEIELLSEAEVQMHSALNDGDFSTSEIRIELPNASSNAAETVAQVEPEVIQEIIPEVVAEVASDDIPEVSDAVQLVAAEAMSEPLQEIEELQEEVAEAHQEPVSATQEETPHLSVSILDSSPALFQCEPVGGAPKTKRALVVDDIPVNLKLLVLQLKRLGYATDTASNGRDALEILSRSEYDIIFMDCDMPVMDGYEATREIRRREIISGTHMPIVAMTSYERTADKEKCVAAGMDDCLVKGMHATAVSGVIERLNAKANEGLVDQTSSTSSATAIDFESLENALAAAGHSQEELIEMVRLFMLSMEHFVSSMQRAIDSKDGDLVTELASSIKGPSASLGLKPLTKVIGEVLTYAEAQDWPQVRLKYLKLKTAYLRTLDQLKKMCPSLFVEETRLIG